MSSHIWEVRVMTGETVSTGIEAAKLAVKNGLNFDETCTFVGYALESIRQKGGISINSVWKGGVRSKHRYARGKNGPNYRLAGQRVLCWGSYLVGLDSIGMIDDGVSLVTAANIVWDKMSEEVIQ